jgi:hypothetical protein
MTWHEGITVEDIIAKVREIANENPDYTYVHPEELDKDSGFTPGGMDCAYVHLSYDDSYEGGCIFGRALIDLGMPADELHDVYESKGIEGVLENEGIVTANEIATSKVLWITEVQTAQDGRSSYHDMYAPYQGRRAWGEAVRIADEKYPLLDL